MSTRKKLKKRYCLGSKSLCELSEQRFSLANDIFMAAVDAIIVTNDNGVLQSLNKSAEILFGFSSNEVLGKNISIFIPNDPIKNLRSYPNKTVEVRSEVIGQKKDRSFFLLYVSRSFFWKNNQRFFVIICHEISEQSRLAEDVVFLAKNDSLTGCMNRQEFVKKLSSAIKNSQRNRQKIAVLFIDLDNFKQINDKYGYKVGDELLKLIAKRLKNSLREEGFLARVGGDEFAVFFILDSEEKTVLKIATRLMETFKESFSIENVFLRVDVSIGISICADNTQTAHDVLNEADIAMYRAKKKGGCCIRLFDKELRERSEKEYYILSDLHKAISLKEFELYYQLQFDMQTLEPSGLEALLRWNNGSNGLVSTDVFLPVALEYGLMPTISRWVIEQACKDNRKLVDMCLLDVAVAVNVCAQTFSDDGFCVLVNKTLTKTGLSASHLELEITEDVAMKSEIQVLNISRQLQSSGISLVIDDFGIGFSSLSRLKKLPFKKLKLDRSFISNISTKKIDKTIIQSVVGITKALGICSVAEGVETEEQLFFLQEAGCDQGQGFFYARPMPLVDLISWLRKRK